MTRNAYGAVLAMHMDGANNGTAFVDFAGNAVTPHGSAVTSTAQSKFGGSSAYFNGYGYLSIPSSAAFAFGTGDFTIEMWLRPASLSGYACFFQSTQGSAPYLFLALNTGSSGTPLLWSDANIILGSSDFALNQWQHFALSRQSGTVRMFLGGAQVGSAAFAGSLGASVPVYIGANSGGTQGFNGYIDELVVFPTALYTATFTPPTEEFVWVPPPIAQVKFSGDTPALKARNPATCVSFSRDGAYAYSRFNNGTISDTVAITGSPETLVSRRVTLIDRITMQSVASVWSDPVTGAYSFTHLRKGVPFMVVADDYLGAYNAVVADWVYAV